MPHSVASDLGLHCLSVTILRVSEKEWVKRHFSSVVPHEASPNCVKVQIIVLLLCFFGFSLSQFEIRGSLTLLLLRG